MTLANPPVPDLLYSELEEQLRDTLRDVLKSKAEWAAVLTRTESSDTVDAELWATLATEVGLAGLAVSEEHGGSGASLREVAVVLEELGRAVAPVPFLDAAVTTPALLSVLHLHDLLARSASGESVATLIVPADRTPWDESEFTTATVTEDGRLTGTVRSVSGALTADTLLVPIDSGLYAVGRDDATVTPVVSLDMTRQLSDVSFTDTPAHRLDAHEVGGAVRTALSVSCALLASEQLGLAEQCLAMTVDYLKDRRQFGRVLGSYQSLKHRLADLWVDITQSRAVARYAAACAATGSPDLPLASSLAHVVCSTTAVRAAEECIQLHGGIGFTWEHPAHLYLKRAKTTQMLFGTPSAHRHRIGELAGLNVAPVHSGGNS
ncbi:MULTISPECIES: acyl-CoA dehydrogenase family protein [Mycobacteriaceae]|uniref:Acyl-CoA dehydrogenase FadE18_1 n=2 Tax=Mycolicibacterium fortuitum TaxID=1766 RepID=A0A378V2A6_MYCFO|nr:MULTISPECIES: acyl-CoA dehydrogenase family protein [Mycobacteriaceae]AIY44544.1 Butyryl-CoA dehydrogenase [Mycobacterium sp. VKM Ac-1817D]CRL80728.1 acyl-CoA dehydrogenase FadE18 [Mycolicibacter nonchromogenicus]EJZ11857.1 acyl-CoA dehydrogenase domain-containing protein [Mycolicibacterium fortuitum subsp. fortuitum DSM 46621 = ATCC 6841 = JCM 6387]MCA4756769.1 acyl-CoA/acyl-ACP dehydrogenase [Mycolicibacterium fortuitum]MDG5770544.1 acyl-CoA/acyl-ACP dehydrogenase [Mycolicibacterium fortu